MRCRSYRVRIKNTNLVSRILFQLHHLSSQIITELILLPTLDLGRAALKRSYTWHYSTQGLPPATVTNCSRELLPHVFTFFTVACDSYFLWHYLFPACAGSRLLTGGLLCTVRTFLTDCSERWFGFVQVKIHNEGTPERKKARFMMQRG